MNEHSKEYLGWAFWGMWVLVNTFAWIVGMALMWLFGFALDFISIKVFFYFGWGVAGALFGALFGVNHWFLFRPLHRETIGQWAHWWVLATMGGWSLAVLFVFGLHVREMWGYAVTGIFVGLSSALPQWLVMRPYVQKAGWWVGVSAVTWGISLAILAFPQLMPAYTFPLVGIISGAGPGAMIIWLLRHPRGKDKV